MKALMIAILLLVFCLGAVITVEQKTGKPLTNWSSLMGVDEEGDLVSTVKRVFSASSNEGFSLPSFGGTAEAPAQPVTVYKWQDEEGNWHFSQDAPEAGEHETLTVKAENVVDMGVDQMDMAKKKIMTEYDRLRASKKDKGSDSNNDKGGMESFYESQRKSSDIP